MLGAIAGDIIGRIYEFKNNRIKRIDFPLFSRSSKFTDDTVLTVAVAESLLECRPYRETFLEYCRLYPGCGYGRGFREWIAQDGPENRESYGNGSAMRVSPIGYAFSTLEEVLAEAEKSAIVSHSHPEAVKGAQAVASAIFLARNGSTKEEIKSYIENMFAYNLSEHTDSIRTCYSFDSSCAGSVPQAIRSFYDSTDFESAIRIAISLGGDSDTLAAMSGSIAQAYYRQIPEFIVKEVMSRLDDRIRSVVNRFNEMYDIKY